MFFFSSVDDATFKYILKEKGSNKNSFIVHAVLPRMG
jgi:hypothetical protein